jgi:hypothetical protein
MIVAVIAAAYVLEWSYAGPHMIDRLDLYPYEGFRNRADVHEVGERVNEAQSYKDFDYRFGPLGLFGDIDVRHPPAKPDNEIRIILIGGSGAMGEGARTDDDMLYRKLELRLNELMRDSNWHVQVINLAQGGNNNYQSFIALNRWGHQLDPDVILSSSGRNDLWIPLSEGMDGYLFFATSTI